MMFFQLALLAGYAYSDAVVPRGAGPVSCGPLRFHAPAVRVPAVPGAAHRGPPDPAVVRGLGGGLDDLHDVLPARAAGRLRVLGCSRSPAVASLATMASCRL